MNTPCQLQKPLLTTLQAKEQALAEKDAQLAAARQEIETLQADIHNKANLLKGISQASLEG